MRTFLLVLAAFLLWAGATPSPLIEASGAQAPIRCVNDWRTASFSEPLVREIAADIAAGCADSSRVEWDRHLAEIAQAISAWSWDAKMTADLRKLEGTMRQEQAHLRAERARRAAGGRGPAPPGTSMGGIGPPRTGIDWRPVITEFTESPTQRRQREEFARSRAAAARTPPRPRVRNSILSGDWAGAVKEIDQALSSSSTTAIPALASAIGDLLTDDGLLAFQQANNEYRLAHDWRVRLFAGSEEGDRLYGRAAEALDRARSLFERLSAERGGTDLASVTAGLANARRELDETRASEASGTSKDWVEAADGWRQAVVAAATSAAIRAANPALSILPSRVAGEDDAATIAFVRRAQASCSESRDVYCAAVYARTHKDDRTEDPRLYPSRRNAEHYLFANALSSDLRLGGLAGPFIGAPAVAVFTPAYALVKEVWPGSRFAGSLPSIEQLRWGYWGAVVGVTGKFDPTK